MIDGLNHAQLLAFARPLVGETEAEDVVQQAYLRMLTTRAPFAGGSARQTWACAIVRAVALDVLRARSASPISYESDLSTSEAVAATPPSVDDQMDGTKVFARLNGQEQQLLLANGRTAADVAREWGCPASRIKTLRMRLRRRIEELTCD